MIVAVANVDKAELHTCIHIQCYCTSTTNTPHIYTICGAELIQHNLFKRHA